MTEGAIAAGIRRIEAVTGLAAEKLLDNIFDQLHEIRAIFNNTPNLHQAVHKMFQENDSLRQEVERALIERVHRLKEVIISKGERINGINVMILRGPFLPEVIRRVATALRSELEGTLFVAGYTADDKPALSVMVTDDLVARGIDAGNMIREAAKLIEGGGGGQPFFATAAGKDANGLDKAIDYIIQQATDLQR